MSQPNDRSPPAVLPGATMLPPLAAAPAQPRGTPPAAGRFGEVNAFADATLRALSRAEIAVWLVLWRDTRPNGLARTGQEDIARRAGCDARTVRRAIGQLAARRLLTVVRTGRIGTGPSVYRVRGAGPAG